MKEEMKYCKFCDEEKPIKEFCKSGSFIKNICKKCQNEEQKKIYSDSKKVRLLEAQLKAKEEAENIFKEWLEDNWKQSQDIWFVKVINKYNEILSKGENK